MNPARFSFLFCGLLMFSPGLRSASAQSPQPSQRTTQQRQSVYKDRIIPHWFHNDTRFWYRNDLREGAKEFVVVDAERGRRNPAFDREKLATALSKATGNSDYHAAR